MDGKFNSQSEVICCFCAEYLCLKDATIINVQPNFESEEVQTLFSHREHFVDKINKKIPLHPDFYDMEC